MTLTDYVSHNLSGMAYPASGNPHPARAVNARVIGVNSATDTLVVRIDDDDLVCTAYLAPLYDDAPVGDSPITGDGEGQWNEEWSFDFDVIDA